MVTTHSHSQQKKVQAARGVVALVPLLKDPILQMTTCLHSTTLNFHQKTGNLSLLVEERKYNLEEENGIMKDFAAVSDKPLTVTSH